MANLNALKHRVGSVKNTKQVTRAMYLISASKSKHAKTKLDAVKPFFCEVEIVLAEILSAGFNPADSVFTQSPRGAGRSLIFAIGGDKGMAGGYNHNLIKFLGEHADKQKDDVLMAGFIGRGRALHEKFRIDPGFMYAAMNPNLLRARDIADIIIERYKTGVYRDVKIIYTTMISALKQEPLMFPLLPLTPDHFENVSGAKVGTYRSISYEPGPAEVFDSLTLHYVKGVVYAALVDSFTSELHARMVAMESATKNADDIILNLSLRYNHARQALITQEITEIVAGIPG